MKNVFLKENDTIKQALEIIDKGAMKIAFVVDNSNKLIGSVSDGDIRRALLNGKTLEDKIENIYNKNPLKAHISDDRKNIINLCLNKKIYQIPLVDDENRIVDIFELEEALRYIEYPNKVVLMVGGLGTRLRPLTEKTPKPMLKVGNKPILQTIVEQFRNYGFKNFIFCVNYKNEIIKDYFKDGKEFGVNIEYVLEEKRMGTAGALSLISKNKLNEPFFVMNGDILTNVNFENMMQFHLENNAIATMGVRNYSYTVPFGVVEMNSNLIIDIKEKPTQTYFVSAGIYVLNPETLSYIPYNEYYDIPELFKVLIKENKKTISFPIREYWLDIGRIEEYERANKEYERFFNV
ncbi:nucleotidyltransferase family protein [Caminibacter mediatlanticus]|uniref:Nucleotidyl transferase n=1 Tax=Caminibacter mediatlanticus TB-2 TaxID=391592 RepID=A0AAI9F0Y9_9BACT|nr:nucleotidyltransferase family protein [Caminibacter mediatlanticus]EDM23162.1 Nucleotidyl transferase [Caminibacter mediatlanticus TB-2]